MTFVVYFNVRCLLKEKFYVIVFQVSSNSYAEQCLKKYESCKSFWHQVYSVRLQLLLNRIRFSEDVLLQLEDFMGVIKSLFW
jgi:hypothetical protein